MKKDTHDGIQGKLHIHFQLDQGKVERVRIRSSRPVGMTAILLGRSVSEALVMIPKLFMVGPLAHQMAAVTALESALGLNCRDVNMPTRNLLVTSEIIEEHLMRIYLDWPRLVGERPREGLLQHLSQLFAELRRAIDPKGEAFNLKTRGFAPDQSALHEAMTRLGDILTEQLLGQNPIPWLHGDMRAWVERGASDGATMLKVLMGLNLHGLGPIRHKALQHLKFAEIPTSLQYRPGPEFALKPTLAGEVLEATPLSRLLQAPKVVEAKAWLGQGLGLRLFVRVLEIAQLFVEMQKSIERPTAIFQYGEPRVLAEEGISQIESARGKLIHWVKLEGERIREYLILDPTEWNFHPNGPLVHALQGIKVPDAKQAVLMADLLIHAFDPSVEYEILSEI